MPPEKLYKIAIRRYWILLRTAGLNVWEYMKNGLCQICSSKDFIELLYDVTPAKRTLNIC